MREKSTGGWIKLHNGELHDLYCSPTISGVVKLRLMGEACGVCGGEEKCILGLGE
jgi:hypothetical protein